MPTDDSHNKTNDLTLESELRVYEDMLHQLKSPLNAAFYYTSELQAKTVDSPSLSPLASRLHGLLRKAKSVTSSLRLLRVLHSEISLPRVSQSVSSAQLLKLVSECARDFHALNDPTPRKLNMEIDRRSFDNLAPAHFAADTELLEQALFNILDNAFKYSYPDTTIRVKAVSGTEFIRVETCNRGLPMRANEAELALERGWRGTAAMAVTGEGSGLGLWLANVIARAHGGAVEIQPTDASGDTIVTLVLSTTN